MLKRLQVQVTGSNATFSLEARIYHCICIVAFVALAYNVPFNYFVGLPQVALVSLIMLIGFAGLYYISRVKKNFTYSVIGMGVLGNIFFAVVYFLNSGIDGPTLILFALFYYLQTSTAPKNQQLTWLMVNVVTVGGVCFTEFFFPHLVPSTYPTLLSRFTDNVSAYMVVVVSIFFSLKYIRQNYEVERKSAVDRAVDIELKNIQLELLNAEKNKLFSIVAHDLRSPLASIQSYLELLTAYPLSEKEKKEVELKLLTLTKNTSNMMANLLSWSKSQLDGVRVNIRPMDLLKTLRDMLKVEANIAQEKGISLSYHLSKDMYVLADADMLMLVIRNLISNAIKFTPAGGSIQVLAVIEQQCTITIVDSGAGISEANQKDVFSLEAKSTFGTNNEKGVGLGLILCKEFTELQNGTIRFISAPGQGTSFMVSIPVFHQNLSTSSQQGELSDQFQ